MKRKLLIGDIFRFGDPTEGWGYGQILRSNILQYIVVFQPKFRYDSDLHEIVMSPPLLSGWTMDAKLERGDWERVGNLPPAKLIFPEYKVEVSGQVWVVDVDGNLLRPATAKEASILNFKSSNSPIAFEKAFKAHHGELPWEAQFDSLQAKI